MKSSILEELYRGTRAAVWYQGSLSPFFDTKSVVNQGCKLNPYLYSIYINDIDEAIESGISVGRDEIKLLAYADDVVFVTTEPRLLQNTVNSLQNY